MRWHQARLTKISDAWNELQPQLEWLEIDQLTPERLDTLVRMNKRRPIGKMPEIFPLKLGIRYNSKSQEKLWSFFETQDPKYSIKNSPTYFSSIGENDFCASEGGNDFPEELSALCTGVFKEFKELGIIALGRTTKNFLNIQPAYFTKPRAPYLHADHGFDHSTLVGVNRLAKELPTLILRHHAPHELSENQHFLIEQATNFHYIPLDDYASIILNLQKEGILVPAGTDGEFAFMAGTTKHTSFPKRTNKPVADVFSRIWYT